MRGKRAQSSSLREVFLMNIFSYLNDELSEMAERWLKMEQKIIKNGAKNDKKCRKKWLKMPQKMTKTAAKND